MSVAVCSWKGAQIEYQIDNVNDKWERAEFQFSPDGKAVICLMPDRTLTSFDAETGRELWRLSGPHWFHTFTLTSDGKTLLTSDVVSLMEFGTPFGIRVWDVATRRQIRFINVPYVYRFSLDGDVAAILNGGEKTVPIVNWKTGKAVRTLTSNRFVQFTSPLFLPDGNVAIISQIVLSGLAAPLRNPAGLGRSTE